MQRDCSKTYEHSTHTHTHTRTHTYVCMYVCMYICKFTLRTLKRFKKVVKETSHKALLLLVFVWTVSRLCCGVFHTNGSWITFRYS